MNIRLSKPASVQVINPSGGGQSGNSIVAHVPPVAVELLVIGGQIKSKYCIGYTWKMKQ